MSTPFPRTVESLRIDRFRGSLLVLTLVTVLLAGWLAWFFLATITRYEVTAAARLEIDQEATLVQAPVTARVETTNLVLGRQVRAGEILVELDSNSERLQVQEERRRLAGLSPQIASLRDQIANVNQSSTREQRATRTAVEQAAARFQEADAAARQAEANASRLALLRAEKLASERDYEQARFDAERQRHAADGLRLEAERLDSEQRTRESDRGVESLNLQGQTEKMESDGSTILATIQRLEYEVERRSIRAPVSGTLGDVAVLRPGAVVQAGEKLGAIVPSGKLRAVAQFPPSAALGRIRVGQRARMRLDGFPWAQYGSIPATVSRVAGEVRDGQVRVELGITPTAAFRVPLQHGLPGSVEIEVERLTPAALLLRTAGRLLAAPQ
jgi:membrane fusion protein (multidrug efflux system)